MAKNCSERDGGYRAASSHANKHTASATYMRHAFTVLHSNMPSLQRDGKCLNERIKEATFASPEANLSPAVMTEAQ